MTHPRKLEITLAHNNVQVFCKREICMHKNEATSHVHRKNLFCNVTLLPLVQKVEVVALLSGRKHAKSGEDMA